MVFSEVKTHRFTDFGVSQEALSHDKRRRLSKKVALGYLAHQRIKDANYCFDVVSVLLDDRKVEHIEPIKDAFETVY